MSVTIAPTKYCKKGNEKHCPIRKLNNYFKSNKTGYEIIDNTVNEYVKPYFDIDVHDYEQSYETIRADKSKFLKSVKKFITSEFKCLKNDLAISETVRDNKISFHIVIYTKKVNYDKLRMYISDHTERFKKYHIDISVYGKYQKVRLINCCKEGDKAIKKILTKKKASNHIITYVEGIEDVIILAEKAETIEAPKADKVKKTKNNVPFERLYNICDHLDASRLSDRRPWSLIMMAINNISTENGYQTQGAELIHTISKKDNKYISHEVTDFIDSLKYDPSGKNLGYLLELLKEDDKESFKFNTLPYDKSYDKLKEEFEKEFFKMMYPVGYCKESAEDIFIYKPNDFMKAYQNKYYWTVEDGELNKGVFPASWVNDETIRTYERMDFYPNPSKCPKDIYNLFNGLEVEKLPEANNEDKIQLILNHIMLLVGNCEESYNYFLKWLAQIVQQPEKLIGIAAVFVSEQGVGKNIFTDWIGNKILGPKYYNSIQDTNHVYGNYAEGLKHKLLINLDEASGKDNFQNSDKLKHLITSPTIMYEKKYMASMKLNNFCRFIFTTNNDTSVKIEHSDRRFVIFKCESAHRNDRTYFNNLIEQMNDQECIKTFYNFLMNINIEGYDFINNRPFSQIYKDMQAVNHPKEVLFIMDRLDSNKLKSDYKSKDLFELFQEFLFENGYTDYKSNNSKLTRTLTKLNGITKYKSSCTKLRIDKDLLIKQLVAEYMYTV